VPRCRIGLTRSDPGQRKTSDGAIVGGILGGVLTSRPGGAAAGAIVGGTTGAVIGAQAEQRHGYYLEQGVT
jgi:outer membrane lipoprotein SlyB